MTHAEIVLNEIITLLKENEFVPEVMNAKQAKTYLGISETYLWKLKGLYQIPFSKIGGRIVFRKKDLDKWLEQNTVRSAEDEKRLLDGRRKVA